VAEKHENVISFARNCCIGFSGQMESIQILLEGMVMEVWDEGFYSKGQELLPKVLLCIVLARVPAPLLNPCGLGESWVRIRTERPVKSVIRPYTSSVEVNVCQDFVFPAAEDDRSV